MSTYCLTFPRNLIVRSPRTILGRNEAIAYQNQSTAPKSQNDRYGKRAAEHSAPIPYIGHLRRPTGKTSFTRRTVLVATSQNSNLGLDCGRPITPGSIPDQTLGLRSNKPSTKIQKPRCEAFHRLLLCDLQRLAYLSTKSKPDPRRGKAPRPCKGPLSKQHSDYLPPQVFPRSPRAPFALASASFIYDPAFVLP